MNRPLTAHDRATITRARMMLAELATVVERDGYRELSGRADALRMELRAIACERRDLHATFRPNVTCGYCGTLGTMETPRELAARLAAMIPPAGRPLFERAARFELTDAGRAALAAGVR